MGKQVYEHCPTSPESPGGEKMGRRNDVWTKRDFYYVMTVAVLVIFSIVFLGLYLEQRYPARQMQQCQLQNQTEAQVTSRQKLLEETWKEAARNWSHKLEAMNESLVQTHQDLHSCQNQLNTLQENITSWKAAEHKWKEKNEDLNQQLSNKTSQLEKLQKERESCKAEIQTLREQHGRKQKQSSNGGNFFGGPSIVLLIITLAGSLKCVKR